MIDEEIIKKILGGNKNLYSKIMDKYHNELFKYVYNIVNDYTVTEDLLQEIFFRIYKNLNKYNSKKASFRTWMYRVAQNYVFNYLNKASTRLKKNTYEYDDSINKSKDDVEEEAIKSSKIDQIIKAMEKVLKPKQLKIMQLHYFSNLSVKEISEVLGIPDKTIYKSIKTSVEKIKKEVEEYGEI